MKQVFAIILILSVQACAPKYISPFHEPNNNQAHAVLQSTMQTSCFLSPSKADLQINSINGKLISPREEVTWKLNPYSKFNIVSGDTFVEVKHIDNDDYVYVHFTAKVNKTYTISYNDTSDKQFFILQVQDMKGNVLAKHTFRKKRWGEYTHPEKEEAMFDAIAMNDTVTLQRLLKEGTDPNWIEANSSLSALFIVAKENNLVILALLIASGIWIDSYEGALALSISAKLGNIEMLKILLKNGANPNQREIKNNSALMEASKYGHISVVRTLLEHGVYTKFRNIDGKTAYDLAQEAGHEEIVLLLSQ